MAARALACLILAIGLGGCNSTKSSPNPPQTPTTFTGVLQSGIMAIGGEHTGWLLSSDDPAGGIEVDVSRVSQQARELDGKRVIITGPLIDRQYVERGRVRILQAERIIPAPAQP